MSIEGKWKYICKSFDYTYEHGGRFTVQKDRDGAYQLTGMRMWRDDWDSARKVWIKKRYSESEFLTWHSDWIFVRNNNEINFQYSIPGSKITQGYCTGQIIADKEKVQSVDGTFYVLTNNPVLTGYIFFRRVSDSEYNDVKTTLPKLSDSTAKR